MRQMTEHEYISHQCDKCEEYEECQVLDRFLKLWRTGREFKEYISDGCDLAKACHKFRKELK